MTPILDADKLPRGAKTIIGKLAPGWTWRATAASGPCAFSGLSEEADGNGRRTRVELVEVVDSVLLRLCHMAARRAALALWIKRPDKGWKLDLAWRGRHDGEHTPQRLTARELAAYVAMTTTDQISTHGPTDLSRHGFQEAA